MADEISEDKYFDWYEPLTDLEQGAVLTSVLVFEEADPRQVTSGSGDDAYVTGENGDSDDESEVAGLDVPVVAAREINAIVLTQSCDIRKLAQQRILVAEVQSYREITADNSERSSSYRKTQYREDLISGTAIAEFVIPPSQSLSLDWSIVNFRELFIVDRDRLMRKTHLMGLASPYREHLGQAFARFMMRVGLPQPLHEFKGFKPWQEK